MFNLNCVKSRGLIPKHYEQAGERPAKGVWSVAIMGNVGDGGALVFV